VDRHRSRTGDDVRSPRSSRAKKGLTNIEFREASAEALPFPSESYDVLTCRFGINVFSGPPQSASRMSPRAKARRARRVRGLGQKEQPFFTTKAGVVLKHVPVPPPPPESRRPESLHVRRARPAPRALQRAGFNNVHKKTASSPGAGRRRSKSTGSSSAKSPRPSARSSSNSRRRKWLKAKSEIFAALKRFWDGKELNMPLENRHRRHGRAPLSGISAFVAGAFLSYAP